MSLLPFPLTLALGHFLQLMLQFFPFIQWVKQNRPHQHNSGTSHNRLVLIWHLLFPALSGSLVTPAGMAIQTWATSCLGGGCRVERGQRSWSEDDLHHVWPHWSLASISSLPRAFHSTSSCFRNVFEKTLVDLLMKFKWPTWSLVDGSRKGWLR